MIKTFRGLMADDTQDTILLHTNDGSTGYKVVKFEAMSNNPGADSVEGVVKIYKVAQTSIDGTVDFSDNTLLAAIEYHKGDETHHPLSSTVIFDQEIVNQDIYVTYNDLTDGVAMNYYIELEQVKLDLNENTVATLKDIRNTKIS